MLFKETYRRAERYRLRKKLKTDLEGEMSADDSSPTVSNEDERASQYLDFKEVKKLQDELDNLTFHINTLKAEILALAESNGDQAEMAFKESIANAFDQERFELSERKLGQAHRK